MGQTTLPEVLRSHAVRQPRTRAFVFVDEHETETAVLTYGDLYARALAVAAALTRHCRPGDRALLLFPQSLDFIVAYFGCLYAQVVAVPVSPPRGNRIQEATRAIVRDCEPAAVLSIGPMAETVGPMLAAAAGPLPWLAVDELTGPDSGITASGMTDTEAVNGEPAEGGLTGSEAAGAAGTGAGGFRPLPCSPDSIAFLQYTSGSTATPKGVMVSHGNLLANQEMIKQAFGHDSVSTVVGWAPLFHDQGLIGNVLQPLYLGATAILLSPTAFIRWPLLWLSVISRYRAHTSGGPNFAFDACVARAARGNLPDLDLSCWKVAFNGAEPIHPATLRRFAETFAPFGFSGRALYPCYGLSEATLFVTGSRRGRGPRTIEVDAEALGHRRLVRLPKRDVPAVGFPAGGGRTLVGSGAPLTEDTVRIVDPETGRRCAPDEVGEIWVAGGQVAQGYWRRPATTAETFRAECVDEPGRPWLRTGDLGVLVDGELYVVGRIKDIVIIRGRNYYPQDIEHTAQSAHPALRPGGCAAFSVPAADGEKLVVVQEIRAACRQTADPADVAATIRAAVVREHGLALGDLVLTLPGRLQKTSSGKIMRAAARRRYLAGGFEVWAPRSPAATASAATAEPSAPVVA
ncbi:MAG: fatty acyl-AMP ligase [Frankia sp.]|nr:fatty acyl-AMP ligase [Frankia sp.]